MRFLCNLLAVAGLDAPPGIDYGDGSDKSQRIAILIVAGLVLLAVCIFGFYYFRNKAAQMEKNEQENNPFGEADSIKQQGLIRLRELREDKNLLQKDVAAALGIPVQTYVEYENGTRKPDSDILIRMANFFGCSIDTLVGRAEPAKTTSPPREPRYEVNPPPYEEEKPLAPTLPHEPRYEINPPPYGEEPPPSEKKSCLPTLLVLVLVAAIGIGIWKAVDKDSYSEAKNKVEEVTSRKVTSSDISIDFDYSFPVSLAIKITALKDIRELVLTINYLDSNGNTVKTSRKVFGDFYEGETKTQEISLTEFSWDELKKIDSCSAKIYSGTVFF